MNYISPELENTGDPPEPSNIYANSNVPTAQHQILFMRFQSQNATIVMNHNLGYKVDQRILNAQIIV